MSLATIANILRAGQLYGHHAHLNCKGLVFQQDHEFFATIYTAMEEDYDAVVERIIGTTTGGLDTLDLTLEAVRLANCMTKAGGTNNIVFYKEILKLEVSLCAYIDKCISSDRNMPEGTRQLIGNIADKSMIRQYKIKQRIG